MYFKWTKASFTHRLCYSAANRALIILTFLIRTERNKAGPTSPQPVFTDGMLMFWHHRLGDSSREERGKP